MLMIQTELTKEQEQALNGLFGDGTADKPTPAAYCIARVLDAFGFHEWADKILSSRYDGDRLLATIEEFDAEIEAQRNSTP